MDDGKVELNPDLTSSNSDELLFTKNYKTDANDSTPTSSTDAASSFSGAPLNVSEDPISSTSSDVMEKDKLLSGIETENNEKDTVVSKTLLGTDGDVDLLDMNIANVSSEPINEDVEDIVQDLENLLGEPEPRHDFPTRRKDKTPTEEKDLLASLDEPLGEQCEPNINPETSDTQSSEKNEIDHLIQPESNKDQIAITEGSSNAECSINESDTLPEKQGTSPVISEDKNECLEKIEIEKTEDVSCKSEELQLTPGQLEEITQTEITQQEAPSETVELNSEVNSVTSSEVIVGDQEKQESSHSPELNIVNSNEVKEVEVKEKVEVEEMSSEKIFEEQDSSIPVEMTDQQLTTHDSNTIGSCEKDENKSCDHGPKDDQHVEATKEVVDSEDQQFLVTELESKVDEEIVPKAEEEKSTDSTVTAEPANIDLLHPSSADPVQDTIASELTDVKNTPSEVLVEKETSDEIPIVEEPEDDLIPASSSSTEEVIEELVDNGSEIKNMPDRSSTIAIETKVEVDPNVTSSSDLSNNPVWDVKDPIIVDCTSIENVEENCETHSEEFNEIIESKEPIVTEPEELDDPNVNKHVEEIIPTNETLIEEILEEEISPESEISTGYKVVELDNVLSAEKSVTITDVSMLDENSSTKEEILEETPVIDDTTKLEENHPKVEEISDTIEDKSETFLEDTIIEQLTKEEEIPEESLAVDISTKLEDNQTREDETVDTVEEKSISIMEQSTKEIISGIDDSTKLEENQTKEEKSEDLLDIEPPIVLHSPVTIEESGINDYVPSTHDNTEQKNESTPSEAEPIENSVETQEVLLKGLTEDKLASVLENVERADVSTSENSKFIATNEAATETNSKEVSETEIVAINEGEESNLSLAGESNNKEELSDAKLCVNENEVMKEDVDIQPIGQDITEQIEENKTVTIEEESAKKDLDEEEINQTPPVEILDQETVEQKNTSPEIIAIRNLPSTEDIEEREADIVESTPEISEETEKQDEEETEKQDEEETEKQDVEETEKQYEEETSKEVSTIRQEIIETTENINRDNVEETTGSFEEGIIAESVNAEKENTLEVSCSVYTPEVIETSCKNENILKVPIESNTVELGIVHLDDAIEESCSIRKQDSVEGEIKSNKEFAELSEDNVSDVQKSIEDAELVPVNEELCIKKVVIYEHDCESHGTNQSNITSNDEKRGNSDAYNLPTTDGESSDVTFVATEEMSKEKVTDRESESLRPEEIISEKDQCMVDSSISVQQEENEESSIIPEISDADNAKIEENVVVNEQTYEQVEEEAVKESGVSEDAKIEETIKGMEENEVGNEEADLGEEVVQESDVVDARIKETERNAMANEEADQREEEAVKESDVVEDAKIKENIEETVENVVANEETDQGEEETVKECDVAEDANTEEIVKGTEENVVENEEAKQGEEETVKESDLAEVANTEEAVQETEENVMVNEHTFEPDDRETIKESELNENISQIEKEEVTSSDQHDDEVEIISSDPVSPDNSKVIDQSSPEILENIIEESSVGRSVEKETHIPEQMMEDQTTAAVQSILNNMLTEERNVEKIIEKDEPPVVHSSYSSYEVQKAVQELQGITVEAVEISPEDIECISSSEKPCESEKIEFENENFAATNISSQDEVQIQISDSKESGQSTISKSEEPIEISESSASEEIFDDKAECIQEIIDSPLSNPENQDAIAQSSSEANRELDRNDKCSSVTSQIDEPMVVPSIDLSEESTTEEDSDEDKKHNVVSSSVTSTSVIKESDSEEKDSKNVTTTLLSKASGNTPLKNESKKYSPRETRQSSRISERMKPHNPKEAKEDINQPLSVNIEEIEKEKSYSPKVTIKPIKEDDPNEDKEEHKGSLKITITKQSDNTHSILKMCSPDVEHRQKQNENEDQNVVPKLVIKTSDTHSDQHSPKMSTRSSKQVLPANSNIRSGSPRITIKPLIKPDSKETITSPLKLTIKPIGKPEEFSRQQQRHSPKQLKNKMDDDHYSTRSKVTKFSENSDVHSPKVTIKPVKAPDEAEVVSTPKITIKPIEKPEEARISPKITIKPVVRPVELETEVEDEVKERIVLKINKGNLPPKDTERIGRESRKRELEDDKSEKLAKIKLKFSKDGDAHIVHKKETEVQNPNKRAHDFEVEKSKRLKTDVATTDSDEDVKLIENTQSPIVISEDSQSQDSVIIIEEAKDPLLVVATPEPIPQVTPVSAPRKRGRPRKVPLVVREEFGNEQREKTIQATGLPVPTTNQPIETETTGRPKRSCRAQSVRDTLGIKPRKPSKPRGGKRGAKSMSMKPQKEPGYSEDKINAIKKSLLTEEALRDARTSGISRISSDILSKKLESRKEEPIKPLGLKSLLEAAKDQNIIEVIEVDTPSNSPKCLETVEIGKVEEEGKPSKIGVTEKDIISTSESLREIKGFQIQKEVLGDGDCNKESSDFGVTDAAASDVEMQPPTPVFAPPLNEVSAVDISSTTDIAMFEEETRMSADASSRAQTPAKQVVSADVVVEESQSSIQSTATTESGKISRRSRLEVHQDQDGSIFTADQLNEYYWSGNGPFMIQEQVAQYLGIKSFKRKYPGIPRRMVDMQERDYIRENGLASESMCDLGLTAVNSADILDIMYTDFQEKYEEFCRFQRDKQAKDLLNKQKALSMTANQEKSKLDILEQAVQSAAAYNANFNKARREQRRACMDLQTMNIHYPKGKLKKISMPRIGNYPVAVVPGQFTDYYKEFTPTELNNLPLNTMLYSELHKILPDISDSDSDSSGSDSDDSSSSGSESNSSCEDNCKMCDKGSVTPRKSPVNSSV